MLLHVNPDNPQGRLIGRIVETLKQGGLIAYPTDTTYGIGCNIFNSRGIKNIYKIKQRDARKPFSFICADLSDAANYAHVSNFAFNSLTTRQKTVGIRIPDDEIAMAIVRELGHPLVTTSANLTGETPLHDPQEIDVIMGKHLDIVIDGGIRYGDPSTVISLIGDRIEVLREGCGDISWIDQL